MRKFWKRPSVLPERQTVTVSTKSWHGKLYAYWRSRAKYKAGPSYRENLCHYVRVVLFWAPITAFLHAHPKRWPIVRPATVLFTLAVASGGGYATYNYPGDVGRILLIIAVCAAAIALFVGALFVIDEFHKDIGDWIGKSRGGRFLKWIGRGIGGGIEVVFEFFGQPLTKRVKMERGWLLLIVPAAFALGVAFAVDAIKTLAYIGVGVGVVAIIALVVAAGFAINDWIKSRPRKFKPRRAKHGDGLGTVLGQYAVARKHQVCPFIEVES